MEFAYIKKRLANYFVSMKKLVIVKSGCREFGNELLNHMSVYACGLELGARVINHSGFGYTGLWRLAHTLYARMVSVLYSSSVLLAWRAPIYLPPTKNLAEKLSSQKILHLYGWLFRNPAGLEKYRKELLLAFTPAFIQQELADSIHPQKGKTLIGVHIRQKNFTGFESGEFLVSPIRTLRIVEEHIQHNSIDPKNVAMLIVSDLPIAPDIFARYPVYVVQGNTEKNLFLLSRASIIVGTNTTFSNMAAWFGNVPHVVVDNEPLDWEYYKNKVGYFENKYATFAY